MAPPEESRSEDEEPQTEEEEDDDDDEVDIAPPEFHTTVSQLLPRTSRRDIYSAWDKTKGIGGGAEKGAKYDSGSARVQAALGILFDQSTAENRPQERRKDSTSTPTPLFRTSSPPTPTDLKDAPSPLPKSASTSRNDKRPSTTQYLELSDSDSESDLDVEVEKRRPVAKKVKFSEGASPKKVDKGKGKAKEVEVLELDDDDDEDVIIVKPKNKKTESRHLKSQDSIELLPSPSTTSNNRPPAPAPAPPQPSNPLPPTPESLLQQITPLFPDCQPSHILSLLREMRFQVEGIPEPNLVVEWLFGEGRGYPKIDSDGKKEKERDPWEGFNWLDIKNRHQVDGNYKLAALSQLYIDFDLHPVITIKNTFKSHENFYSPTYLALKDPSLQYDPIAKRRVVKAKVREFVDSVTGDKFQVPVEEVKSAELEREKEWLREKLTKERAEKKKAKLARMRETADKEKGLLIECGCCFTDFCFDDMVQCSEAHLFCRDCTTTNVNTQIGMRKFNVPCMHTDGCDAEFTLAELEKILPQTSVVALQKIKQEKEVLAADIEGLATCPYCPYAYVIENPDEKLFRCQRMGCEKTSCRSCGKDPHIPFTCAEAKAFADKDNKLISIHQVEEAMTQALIRRCPKCKEPYMKSDGCNFITCSNCKQGSCFICGQPATHGPPHFETGMGDTGSSKCRLFDDTQVRVATEVENARAAALARVAQANPMIVEDDVAALRVDIPHRPPPIPAPNPHRYLGHNLRNHAVPAPAPRNRYDHDWAAAYNHLLMNDFEAGFDMGWGRNPAPRQQLGDMFGQLGGGAGANAAQAGPAPLTAAERRARAAEAAARRALG